MAAFDWGEYLTLATTLAGQADEASQRSSVSRAYYYVYHLARTRAENNGFRPVDGGVHRQLWSLYKGVPVPECQQLGVMGDRMKVRRERADYQGVYPRLTEEVADMLERAREFSERLGRVDARHPNPAAQRP
jgi:hypothetical protein